MNKGLYRGLGAGMLLRGADPADLMAQQPPVFQGNEPGRWRQHLAQPHGQLAGVQNTLYAALFWVPPGAQIYGLGVLVTTAVASTTARFGVYAEEGRSQPESLIWDSQVALAAGTTGFKSLPVLLSDQGYVWLAVALQGAAGPNVDFTPNGGGSDLLAGSAPATATPVGVSQTGISGALPSPWGTSVVDTARVPMFWVDLRPTD